MALNVSTFLTSVENLFHKNNTTTSSYDISSGLSKRVLSFHKGAQNMYKNLPIAKTLYPAIIVELDGKSEEFGMLGNNKRNIDINFSVIAITDYFSGPSDSTSGLESATIENIKLSQNVEALIRQYPKLSQTAIVMKTDIDSTSYGVVAKSDGTYNSISRTQCIAKILSI